MICGFELLHLETSIPFIKYA